MITLGTHQIDLNDPLVLAVLAAAALVLLILLLLLRASGRSSRALDPLAGSLLSLSQRVQALSDGQHQLTGGLHHVSEAQAVSQTKMLALMEARRAEVSRGMSESLHGTATRTARSLGDLQQRLEAIDKAQANIEKLSGNVLGLQDILSNKQTRGAFGEIQLNDIVHKALPADSARGAMRKRVLSGRRVWWPCSAGPVWPAPGSAPRFPAWRCWRQRRCPVAAHRRP